MGGVSKSPVMDKVFFFLLKFLGVEKSSEIADLIASIILTGAVVLTGLIYYHLNKNLKFFFISTNKRLDEQEKKIEAVEGKTNDTMLRFTKILDNFSDKLDKAMNKFNDGMHVLQELTVYNKAIKDEYTRDTRTKIKEAGLNSWNRCKRKLKEWAKNTLTPNFIKSMSGIDLHGFLINTALEIYNDDDRKTKSSTINPIENELLNVIDFKVLPGLQNDMLPLVNKISTANKYTSEHEYEMLEIIERHQNLWIKYFEQEYTS